MNATKLFERIASSVSSSVAPHTATKDAPTQRYSFSPGAMRLIEGIEGKTGFHKFTGGPGVGGIMLIDPNANSAHPIRVVTYDSSVDEVDRNFINSALHTARKKRIAMNIEADAYRLVNGVGDGLPGLDIDVYGSFGWIHQRSRFYSPFINDIAEFMMVELNLQGVYLTKLHRRTERQQFEGSLLTGKGPTDKNQKVVHEYGLKHIIDLEGGAATGLHMDQRDNRKRVANLLIERAKSRPDSPSASLLNTFSYTCSFSLAAAKLMAEQNAVLNTLNVDTSPVALKVGKSNFSRNELSAATHSFVRDDVFRHLSKNKDAKFDVVLLDPATTARLQTGKIWSSAKKYNELIDQAAPLVSPGGYIIAFSNTESLPHDKFHQMAWEKSVLAKGGWVHRADIKMEQSGDFPWRENRDKHLKSGVFQKL